MEWKFRKEFQIMPGIKLSYGKNGIRTQILSSINDPEIDVEKLKLKLFKPFESIHEIKSATISKLTSSDLQEFKKLLLVSGKNYSETSIVLNIKKELQVTVDKRISRLQKNLFRFLFKKKLVELQLETGQIQSEITELEEQLNLSRVSLEIDSEDVYFDLYNDVRKAFSLLKQSQKKWDFTSSKVTNMVAERTSASSTITRSTIQVTERDLPILNAEEQPMCFHNINGGDIYFYPGFLIIYESKTEFAIINYAEVDVAYSQNRFIETEGVPSDAKVVDQTWYKVNKDGSPDRRFTSNYQIPIALYGKLHYTSVSGLNEVYCFSNNESTQLFGKALHDYIDAIKKANSLLATFKS